MSLEAEIAKYKKTRAVQLTFRIVGYVCGFEAFFLPSQLAGGSSIFEIFQYVPFSFLAMFIGFFCMIIAISAGRAAKDMLATVPGLSDLVVPKVEQSNEGNTQ